METNVWTQLSALVAAIVSLLSKHLPNQPNQSNGGESPSVQENLVDLTKTSMSVKSPVLRVTRNPTMATMDGVFGDLSYDGESIGVTMERTAEAVPAGTYSAHLEMSQHFGFQTPHIDVPNRTYIEIHPANWPSQLEGCVAVGSSKDGDALDNSKQAFDRMMEVVPQEFTVVIE